MAGDASSGDASLQIRILEMQSWSDASGDAFLEMRVLEIEDLEIHACRRATAEVEAADRWRG